MKKKAPLLVVVTLLVIAGAAGAYWKLGRQTAAPPATDDKKRKVSEPINVIPLEERPYLKIVPLADGRNLEIVVAAVNKDATSAEYELEYQAGSLLQGAFGEIDLESLPTTAKILLGSCSAGGACTYHEDVKGGTLMTRFEGPESYALKSRWKYIDNKAGESEFAAQDAKFQLVSKDLAKTRFLVIFNTAGYPEGLQGTPVSDPYSLTASSAIKGKGTLTLRANEEGSLKIMGWDGQKWHEFEGEVSGKEIKAEVDLMELYIAVK